MTTYSKKLLILPLLAVGLALATVASIHPQASAATTASLQINFGTAPHWGYVPGTRVRHITRGEHPNYDVFRYGGTYYAYDNNRWYASNRSSGTYRSIDESRVPSQFSRVPSQNWKHSGGWQGRNGNHGRDNNGRGPQSGGNDDHR